MGGTISVGSSPLSERKKKLQKKDEEERKKRQRQRQQLEEIGVLVPPVFVANQHGDPPLSSRFWERILRESSSATIATHQCEDNIASDLLSWAYRRNTTSRENDNGLDSGAGPLLGPTLLTEYTTPGLFLSLPVVNDAGGGRFLAALTTPSSSSSFGLPSFVALTKGFDQNSALWFPYPFAIETIMPQQVMLWPSSKENDSNTNLPKSPPPSMRIVADLSDPNNQTKNQTKVTWTTHFVEQNDEDTIGGNTASNPLWKKLRGSWIEAETHRADFCKTGIGVRMAAGTTMNGLFDKIVSPAIATSPLNGLLGRPTNQNFSSGMPVDDILRLRLAAEYKESIVASDTHLSLSSLMGRGGEMAKVTNTLVSLNLNGGGGDSKEQQSTTKTNTLPPLWLTLKQSKGGLLASSSNSSSSWSLTLSQVLAFDREIWNILEDRAPRVRNHLGWVCQVEQFQNCQPSLGSSSSSSEVTTNSTEKSSFSVLSLGASAQFNRNIAAKILFESKLGSSSSTSSVPESSSLSSSSSPSAALKFAIILKRWLEPKASLSILQKIDLLSGKWSFVGIGLEIEQDSPRHVPPQVRNSSNRGSSSSNGKDTNVEYQTTAEFDAASSRAPPTKVELPR